MVKQDKFISNREFWRVLFNECCKAGLINKKEKHTKIIIDSELDESSILFNSSKESLDFQTETIFQPLSEKIVKFISLLKED